jgi:hypothetical protein
VKKLILAAGLLCVSAAAMAEDVASTHGVGARIGTDGIGLSYTYGLNKYVDLRAGYSFGSYSYDDDDEGINYKAKLKLGALSGLVDIKPFAGGFRITTGVYSASPELTLNASGRDVYEVGDSEYDGDLRLDGGFDLGSAAPYLGIGWGGTTNGSGFGVSFDLGVLFTGSAKIDLTASGFACDVTDAGCDPTDATSPGRIDVSKDPTFQAELAKERADLEDDAKDFKLWPVLNLGLHYRF